MECNNASEWCFDLSLNFYLESHPEAQCGLKSKKSLTYLVFASMVLLIFFSLRKENIQKGLIFGLSAVSTNY